jgi:hypothetical protein
LIAKPGVYFPGAAVLAPGNLTIRLCGSYKASARSQFNNSTCGACICRREAGGLKKLGLKIR